MKSFDIIFALFCGAIIGFVGGDILQSAGFYFGWAVVFLWLATSFFSLACLWLAYIIGKKAITVFQGAKHILVGGFATVIDLKLFELIIWGFGLFFVLNPLIAKSISFVFSTAIKFLGNKYWTFQKHEKENIHKEIGQFSLIVLVGLVIDVCVFHYLTNILGPQFSLEPAIWTKLSVIFAALVAAIWNFTGDKFIVFKK